MQPKLLRWQYVDMILEPWSEYNIAGEALPLSLQNFFYDYLNVLFNNSCCFSARHIVFFKGSKFVPNNHWKCLLHCRSVWHITPTSPTGRCPGCWRSTWIMLMLWQPNLNLLNILLMASCLGYSMGFMFASYIIPALLGCSYCADAHLRLIMNKCKKAFRMEWSNFIYQQVESLLTNTFV